MNGGLLVLVEGETGMGGTVRTLHTPQDDTQIERIS